MSFWSAVVAIVAIVTFARVRVERYQALRHDDRESPRSLPPARLVEVESELSALRERVAVLERIATDGRHSRDIAAEIESLRDPR